VTITQKSVWAPLITSPSARGCRRRVAVEQEFLLPLTNEDQQTVGSVLDLS
jgi:hypothetical protein